MADSLQIKDEDNKLVIALRNNPFSTEKRNFIGSIPRDTLTISNLAARVKDGDRGLDEYTVLKAAGLLKKECLMAIRRGQAVNLMGLCTCPADGNGSISQDGADWIQVPLSRGPTGGAGRGDRIKAGPERSF